jgi:flagellar export protein FliJ
MAVDKYPLKEVMDVKQRRVEEAEKVLRDKIQALEKEKDKLAQKEAERDKVVQHMRDKLAQLRAEMDHGSSIPKIQQMKSYLKICQERVVVEQKKVDEQKKMVEQAIAAVNAARAELNQKRLEVDKLATHKKEWTQEMRKEEEIEQGKEMDEIGSVIFMGQLRNKKMEKE